MTFPVKYGVKHVFLYGITLETSAFTCRTISLYRLMQLIAQLLVTLILCVQVRNLYSQKHIYNAMYMLQVPSFREYVAQY
jgi:hypothetical protein